MIDATSNQRHEADDLDCLLRDALRRTSDTPIDPACAFAELRARVLATTSESWHWRSPAAQASYYGDMPQSYWYFMPLSRMPR